MSSIAPSNFKSRDDLSEMTTKQTLRLKRLTKKLIQISDRFSRTENRIVNFQTQTAVLEKLLFNRAKTLLKRPPIFPNNAQSFSILDLQEEIIRDHKQPLTELTLNSPVRIKVDSDSTGFSFINLTKPIPKSDVLGGVGIAVLVRELTFDRHRLDLVDVVEFDDEKMRHIPNQTLFIGKYALLAPNRARFVNRFDLTYELGGETEDANTDLWFGQRTFIKFGNGQPPHSKLSFADLIGMNLIQRKTSISNLQWTIRSQSSYISEKPTPSWIMVGEGYLLFNSISGEPVSIRDRDAHFVFTGVDGHHFEFDKQKVYSYFQINDQENLLAFANGENGNGNGNRNRNGTEPEPEPEPDERDERDEKKKENPNSAEEQSKVDEIVTSHLLRAQTHPANKLSSRIHQEVETYSSINARQVVSRFIQKEYRAYGDAIINLGSEHITRTRYIARNKTVVKRAYDNTRVQVVSQSTPIEYIDSLIRTIELANPEEEDILLNGVTIINQGDSEHSPQQHLKNQEFPVTEQDDLMDASDLFSCLSSPQISNYYDNPILVEQHVVIYSPKVPIVKNGKSIPLSENSTDMMRSKPVYVDIITATPETKKFLARHSENESSEENENEIDIHTKTKAVEEAGNKHLYDLLVRALSTAADINTKHLVLSSFGSEAHYSTTLFVKQFNKLLSTRFAGVFETVTILVGKSDSSSMQERYEILKNDITPLHTPKLRPSTTNSNRKEEKDETILDLKEEETDKEKDEKELDSSSAPPDAPPLGDDVFFANSIPLPPPVTEETHKQDKKQAGQRLGSLKSQEAKANLLDQIRARKKLNPVPPSQSKPLNISDAIKKGPKLRSVKTTAPVIKQKPKPESPRTLLDDIQRGTTLKSVVKRVNTSSPRIVNENVEATLKSFLLRRQQSINGGADENKTNKQDVDDWD